MNTPGAAAFARPWASRPSTNLRRNGSMKWPRRWRRGSIPRSPTNPCSRRIHRAHRSTHPITRATIATDADKVTRPDGTMWYCHSVQDPWEIQTPIAGAPDAFHCRLFNRRLSASAVAFGPCKFGHFPCLHRSDCLVQISLVDACIGRHTGCISAQLELTSVATGYGDCTTSIPYCQQKKGTATDTGDDPDVRIESKSSPSRSATFLSPLFLMWSYLVKCCRSWS